MQSGYKYNSDHHCSKSKAWFSTRKSEALITISPIVAAKVAI